MSPKMARHIKELIRMNQDNGEYCGNRKQWEEMNDSILEWLDAVLGKAQKVGRL